MGVKRWVLSYSARHAPVRSKTQAVLKIFPSRRFDTLPATILTFSSRASGEKRVRTALAFSSHAAARSPPGIKPVFHVSGRTITSGAASPAARRTRASARSKFAAPASGCISIWITLTFIVKNLRNVLVPSLYEKKARIAMQNEKAVPCKKQKSCKQKAVLSHPDMNPNGLNEKRTGRFTLTAASGDITAASARAGRCLYKSGSNGRGATGSCRPFTSAPGASSLTSVCVRRPPRNAVGRGNVRPYLISRFCNFRYSVGSAP